MPTELFILTGFLGSGKTTLLKHLLAHSQKKKLAIIINEFATLSIDDELVGKKGLPVKNVAGGCVCCSKGKDLLAQIKELSKDHDTLMLETTGVARIEPIIEIAQQTDVELKGIITVIDSYRFSKAPNLDDETKRQIAHANLIVLNKRDLVSKKDIERIEKQVRKQNKDAIVAVTTQGKLKRTSLNSLPKVIGPEHTTPKKTMHSSSTVCYETSAIIDKEKFEAFVQALPKNIGRAKGIVQTNKGALEYGYATGMTTIEPSQKKDLTKIVFIGNIPFFQKLYFLYKLRNMQTGKNTWQDTKTNLYHFFKQLD